MQLLLEEVHVTLPKDPAASLDESFHSLFFLPQYEQQIEDENGKLLAISKALGTRDKYTEGHGRRVAVYAERLSKRLQLPEEEVDDIRIGGMLHDIGKIGFSDLIFTNTTVGLSKEMHKEIQNHPWTGRVILKNLSFKEPILDYVYYHHERVDGKGYPCGLRKEEIPLGAQIISVADCFDAMTTDRPYQGRKRLSDAFETLAQISGEVLSPGLVTEFIDEIQTNGILAS